MAKKKENFFDKLLNLFLPSNSPEALKKRKLKEIAKNISKTRYSKWYKANAQELTPQMAQFFYSIYKVVGPARPLLAGSVKSKTLKSVTVESCLSDVQKKLLENLSEEAVLEKAKTGDSNKVANEIKRDLKLFVGDFDSKQVGKIDMLYEQLDSFINFVLFDYYFLLRKFDSGIVENNFTYTPTFKSIRGEYLTEELKDFAVALNNINAETNWKEIFQIIKTYKNIQPVHEGQWKKLISALNDLKRSNVLENIIRHISDDFLYQTETIPFTEKVTDSYISNLKTLMQNLVSKMVNEQKNRKTTVMVEKIFGERIPHPMKNYSVENNQPFVKRGLTGYIYAEQMGFLKSFLIEYGKTDIRALCDLFLVRGDWGGSSGMTGDYSESFHSIMQIAEKVVQFDERMAEGSNIAVKFRTLLSRMEREKEAGRQAAKLLNELNETAAQLLNDALKDLVVIGNNFKSIIADYDKPRRVMIQNWKEIEHHSEKPVREWLVASYKKIYDFVMLIKLYQN